MSKPGRPSVDRSPAANGFRDVAHTPSTSPSTVVISTPVNPLSLQPAQMNRMHR